MNLAPTHKLMKGFIKVNNNIEEKKISEWLIKKCFLNSSNESFFLFDTAKFPTLAVIELVICLHKFCTLVTINE